MSLEEEFWSALTAFAKQDNRSIANLIYEIDRRRVKQSPAPGLASALRVYVLNRLQQQY